MNTTATTFLSVPHHHQQQLLVVPKQLPPYHSSIVNSCFPNKSPFFNLRCSSSSITSSVTEDEEGTVSQSESDPNISLSGCKACGKLEVEKGCNGEGRMQGGIATVPGFGWWPIKAYRPCPEFVATGGRYRRQGQSMDEVAGFGRVEKRAASKGTTDQAQLSKEEVTEKLKK